MKHETITDHSLLVEEDDGAFHFMVCHPVTCFCLWYAHPVMVTVESKEIAPGWQQVIRSEFRGEYAYGVHYPKCALEYEAQSIGISLETFWTEDGQPDISDLLSSYVASEKEMEVVVDVTYGWTESTYISPSEYDWEFSWCPKELT